MTENEKGVTLARQQGDKRYEIETDISNVQVHTMPKRYMSQTPSASSKARHTGLLILLLGGFVVLVVLVLLFLVMRKQPDIVAIPEQEQAEIAVKKDNKPASSTRDNPVSVMPERGSTPTSPAASSSEPVIAIASSSAISTATSSEGGNALVDYKKYPKANDSDRDGLSDIEEMLLGSSPNSQDSDSDGYPDFSEISKLYDPAGPSKLSQSAVIDEIRNEDYNYLILYPSLWTIKKVDGNASLILTLGKEQYIQILSQEKLEGQLLDDWYKETMGQEVIADKQRYKRGLWNGIINADGLTYYLEHPSKQYVIVISYSVSNDRTLYYENIFDTMISSLAVLK